MNTKLDVYAIFYCHLSDRIDYLIMQTLQPDVLKHQHAVEAFLDHQ